MPSRSPLAALPCRFWLIPWCLDGSHSANYMPSPEYWQKTLTRWPRLAVPVTSSIRFRWDPLPSYPLKLSTALLSTELLSLCWYIWQMPDENMIKFIFSWPLLTSRSLRSVQLIRLRCQPTQLTLVSVTSNCVIPSFPTTLIATGSQLFSDKNCNVQCRPDRPWKMRLIKYFDV